MNALFQALRVDPRALALPVPTTPAGGYIIKTRTKGLLRTLFVAFLFPLSICAQEISLPSPTAANLGKYAEQGVNLFAGKPDISIPITSIGGKDVVVNVFMTYDATGVRVSEVPDWVGSGWALHAGGVITRLQKSLPDEEDYGYISPSTQEKLSYLNDKLPDDISDFE